MSFPQRKMILHEIIYSLWDIFFFFHPLLPKKALHFIKLLGSTFYLLDGMLPDLKILKFCFLANLMAGLGSWENWQKLAKGKNFHQSVLLNLCLYFPIKREENKMFFAPSLGISLKSKKLLNTGRNTASLSWNLTRYSKRFNNFMIRNVAILETDIQNLIEKL